MAARNLDAGHHAKRVKRSYSDVALDLALGPKEPYAPDASETDLRATDDELRTLWLENRDEAIAAMRAGARPWAWWRFEHDRERPARAAEEAAYLAQLGELSRAEIDELRTKSRLGGIYAATWSAIDAVLARKAAAS